MERGDFETVLPPRKLRPFVRRYLYANRRLQSGLTFHGKPTGYTYFSNFFGEGGNHGAIDGRDFQQRSRWFLFGQITDHEVTFRHTHALRLIIAELTATGHHRLFGIPGSRILGLAAPLEEAAPDQAALARDCFVLGADAGRDDHIAEANAYFSRLAAIALSADPIVEQAVRRLEASNGAVRIARLCEQLGVNPRNLNRRFARTVGITPKFFARVMQINWALGLLYSDGSSELARTAQAAGFYDQAHFSHAMQRFFHKGPREFLRSQPHAYQSFLAGSRSFGTAAPVED